MKNLIGGQDPLFPWVLHPNHLFEYGLELGLSRACLLASAQLTEEDIADVGLLISWQQYRKIADQVATKAEDWGFRFGLRLPIASHGLLGLLALNCVNWEQVIELQENYPLLVSPIFYTERRDTSDYCSLTIHPEFTRDPILDKSMEAYFSMFVETIRRMSGVEPSEYIGSLRIRVRGAPPSYSEEWAEHFHGQIEWGHHVNQIWIVKDLLATRIPNADPLSAEATRRMLQAQLNLLPARKGGLNELRVLFTRGIFKQEDCAKELFTTLPTLKRYLKSACTTFSRELVHYRIDHALWGAAFTNTPMWQLSEQLGFQDVNSFGRLFKQEVGISFSEYRTSCTT